MLKTLARTILVAATLAAGALGLSAAPAAAAPAAADTVRATVGAQPSDVLVAQRYDRGGRCAPRQALRKAYRMGLNRPVIVRDNRRAVVVDGRKRGRLVTVRFAQERGCPVIGVR